MLALAGAVAAQSAYPTNSLNQSIPTTTTFNGSAVPDPTAFTQQFNLNVEDLWDLLIGPVSTANTTTTFQPTPVPSSSLIPPPPLYYSPFPTGQQQPMEAKNESWSFPKDFCRYFIRIATSSANVRRRVGRCRRCIPD